VQFSHLDSLFNIHQTLCFKLLLHFYVANLTTRFELFFQSFFKASPANIELAIKAIPIILVRLQEQRVTCPAFGWRLRWVYRADDHWESVFSIASHPGSPVEPIYDRILALFFNHGKIALCVDQALVADVELADETIPILFRLINILLTTPGPLTVVVFFILRVDSPL